MALTVQQLDPFGAEISDADLSAPTANLADEVIQLAAKHRVLVFRDQRLTDAAFVDFLNSLGPMMFTDGEVPVPGAKDLNIVSNVGRSVPPRSVFHTDTSYVERPPAFTALKVEMAPTKGGSTLFCDQVAAVKVLPATCRDELAKLTVRHAYQVPDGPLLAQDHPILRRHPVSGEIALYLSTPERCSNLGDLPDDRSARLIGALYYRSTKPFNLYRHHWRAGDVVLWDNRLTMHRADHSDVIGDRVLHRGMVRGEKPV